MGGGATRQLMVVGGDLFRTVALVVGVGAMSLAHAGGVIEISAAAPEPQPAVTVGAGRITTLSFADASGAPWPVTEVMGSQAGGLSSRRALEHSHLVFLESPETGASGNVVLLLDGLAAPVHLEIVADETAGPTRFDVRLLDERPAAAAPASDGPASAAPGTDLDEAIRAYLLAHPEVLREALDPSRQLVAQVEGHRTELLEGDGVPLLGDASGAITVVEFFDYRCGYCKRSLEAVRAALSAAGVRLQMREYPILGEDSVRAARAALAAARQGAYERAHFALMAHEGDYDDTAIEGIASDLGLDLDRLQADMSSPEVDALIEANRELAARLGVTGTPAFLVLGPERVQVSPGAVDAERLLRMIEGAG